MILLLVVILMFPEFNKDYPHVSIFDESKPNFRYNQLDASGKIFCKVDWVTMIFTDCTFNDVLSWLKLSDHVSEFLKSAYEQSRGYSDVVKFFSDGIFLETNKFSYYGDSEYDVFDVTVPKLRLEISGTGLDYLRSLGVDFNTYRLTNPPRLPKGATYHYSRIDFAYDFIDYQPLFLDKLIDHCNKHQLPSGRVPLASTRGAIKCKIVTIDRKVCYLGSEQSDRFLRVYDKRLQCINRNTGTYIKDNPYNNPDSWIRVEWQLRNRQAHGAALDPDHDFKTILKQIFECYSMADGTVSRNRSVVDFWNTLFPWREVESRIIQNKSFVQPSTPDGRLLDSWRSIMIRSSMFVDSTLSISGVEQEYNRYLNSLYECNDVSARRLNVFNCKLNSLSISKRIDTLKSGLYIKNGRFYFSFLGNRNPIDYNLLFEFVRICDLMPLGYFDRLMNHLITVIPLDPAFNGNVIIDGG